MGASVTFDGGTLQPRLRNAGPKARRYLALTTQYYSQVMEREARLTAPWTDRTGNARNGLKGIPDVGDGTYGIILAHSVPYGIWLEVRWGGRYAVIRPTLERVGPQYVQAASRVLSQI